MLSCATSSNTAPSGTATLDGSAAAAADAGADASADCGDTQSAPDNCGRCAHSCLGGECAEGKCLPVIISGSRSTSGIAVGADFLYFGDRTTHEVLRVDKRTVNKQDYEVIAKAQQYPYAMTVNGGDLFWADLGEFLAQSQGILDITPNSGAIATLNAAGTVMYLAKPVDQPTEVRIVDDDAYWSTITGIYVAPRAGGPARRVTAERADNLTVDATTVYFVDNEASQLRSIARSATDGTSASVARVVLPDCVEQDADALYVCMNDLLGEKRGGVARVTRAGVVTILVSGANSVSSLRLAGDYVYFSDNSSGIFRVRRDGSEPAEALYSGLAAHDDGRDCDLLLEPPRHDGTSPCAVGRSEHHVPRAS